MNDIPWKSYKKKTVNSSENWNHSINNCLNICKNILENGGPVSVTVLSSSEMESGIQVQILVEAVYVPLRANAFAKGMDPAIVNRRALVR